jgi:hypothetical protein
MTLHVMVAPAFAPFEKGGYGGFAFGFGKIKSKSPSVPLLRRGKECPLPSFAYSRVPSPEFRVPGVHA